VFSSDEIGRSTGPADTDLDGAAGHGSWLGYGPWEADGKTITTELWRIEGEVTAESCSADNPAANTCGGSQKVSGSRFKAEGGEAFSPTQ
jgi:hypothetical protein